MKFRDLWTENNYKYNPNEFHGPTLPYFTLPAAWLNGSHDFNDFTEATFRLVTVCFGVGLDCFIVIIDAGFGRGRTFGPPSLTALSPAMVFYSRYYIHEMLLVFFTALTGIAWWRYGKSGRFGWCVLAGAGLGLMWATKETFVFACFRWRWPRLAAEGDADRCLGRAARHHGFKSLAGALALQLSLRCFSSPHFFTNPAGCRRRSKPTARGCIARGARPMRIRGIFISSDCCFIEPTAVRSGAKDYRGLAVVGFAAGLAGGNGLERPTSRLSALSPLHCVG